MRTRNALWILAAVILYGFGIFFCRSAKEVAFLTYLLLTEPIDTARAENIFTQESELDDAVGFCFWGEKDAQWLSCKETGGTAKVTQVLLSGNPGLMEAGVLAWQDGCFLDEATAQMLFGTTDCSQQTIWCGGRQYRVFGTFPAFRPSMLTLAAEKDGAVLNRCVLSVTADSGAQTASQFLLRWGLQGENIDFYPLWVAVHNILLILPGILLLAAFAYGIRRFQALTFPERVKPGIFLLAVVGLLILLCSRMILLPDMIPSRWSDFSFWGNWLEGQRSNMQLVLLTPMGERHLQMMLDMVKSILSSMAAFLLAAWTLRRQRYADSAD